MSLEDPGGIPGGIPEEVPKGIPGGIPEGVPMGVPRGDPGGMPEGVPMGVPMGVPGGIPEGVPMGVPRGIPEGFPGGVPGGIPEGIPMGVIRLPWGPDGGRGFNPTTPRARALLSGGGDPPEQGARATLRRRFLQLLGGARGRPTRFWLWGGVTVEGVLGATGGGVAVLQVDALGTPLGVQRAALLRGGDVVAFAFTCEK